MTSIRLTYLINTLDIGGAEVGMARLLKELPREYDVTVIALRKGSGRIVEQLPGGVNVQTLEVSKSTNLWGIRLLYQILSRTDILVGSLYHATILGRIAGNLTDVSTVVDWQHTDRFKTRLRREVYKRTSRYTDQVMADSEAVSRMLVDELGFPESKVSVVPIAGIDVDQYRPRSHTSRSPIRIGVLGRLSDAKNIEGVLGIAKRMQGDDVRFEIGGDGPRRAALEAIAQEHSLDNVTFHGEINPANVPQFLRELDIYLQPSNYEGLCITVIEAMATGLPVVASRVGGIAESVVDGKTGYLLPADETSGFVARLTDLAEDAELRGRLGSSGRARAKTRYSREALVEGFLEVLTDIRNARLE